MDIPKAVIPKDKKKIEQLIFALEWQLEQDINDKDKLIHGEALKDLRTALNECNEQTEADV